MSSDRPTFAAAVTCIDGRVHQALTEWTTQRFGVDHVDLITHAGADLALCCAPDADLTHVRHQLSISLAAHSAENLVVAGHADCAANPVSDDIHRDMLRRAIARADAWAPPGMTVVAAWVHPDGLVTELAPEPADGDEPTVDCPPQDREYP